LVAAHNVTVPKNNENRSSPWRIGLRQTVRWFAKTGKSIRHGSRPYRADCETQMFVCSRDVLGQRTGLTGAACIVLLLSFLCQPVVAPAAGLDRLSDGRVVISLKGHRFAFPSDGYDRDHIRFNEVNLQDRLTLRQLIAVSDEQRDKLFERANVPISVGVGQDKSVFLGKFDRSRIQSLSFGFSVGDDQRGCEDWAKEFARVGALERGAFPGNGNDWKRVKDKNYLIYAYSGEKLGGIRAGLTNIHCDALSYCGSSLCLGPQLGFSFQFSDKAVPMDRWSEFLATVDSIISYVLEAEVPSIPRGHQQ
jgi:hypothetical protein